MKTETGFTLIEMLLSMTIVLMLVILLTPILKVMSTSQPSNGLNPLEWEVLLQQVNIEIREAQELSLGNKGNILYFKRWDGKVVSYEPYQNMIRRRVNGTGHEVILQRIKSVHYELVTNGVEIMIVDLDGKVFMSRLTSIAELKVNN